MSTEEPIVHNDQDVKDVVSCILGDPAILSRGNARLEESRPQDSLIQALVIGIDKYQAAPPIKNLAGAVADAKSMYEYLHHELNVPAEQIVELHNERATRDAILTQIRALSARRRFTSSGSSVPVKKGDPILIYFAGHGTSGKAPDGWDTETGNISMLVPYDGSSKDASCNILDRTMATLLHELAEGGEQSDALGDNITVILDCCHSGSGTREFESEHITPHLERGFELDEGAVIPSKLDKDVWGVVYSGRSTDTPTGFAYAGTRSHVLLAACRESEKAYESSRRGIFTQTLLAELRRIKTDKITYQGLMQRVVKPISHQNPQCEGYNSNRLLFDALAPSAGRTVYDFVKKDDGTYVLHAGSLHGVTKGAEFNIYSSPDFTASDPPLTTIAVKAVKAFTCRPRDDVPELPSPLLYAHQISMGQAEALRLYISSSDVLRPVITAFAEEIQPQKEVENRILLGSKAEADISLESEPSGVRFHVHDSLIKSYGLEKLSQRVPPEPHRIRAVLRAASHFLWHLRHEPAPTKHRLRDRVDISFHKLERGTELDSSLRKMWKPSSGNLIVSGAVQVDADNKTAYGMTLRNNWEAALHVWIFYFDCSDLSIVEYYKPPDSGPGGRGEATLLAGKQLPIGYGSGGARPFKYHLEGPHSTIMDQDVGFIKIYVSNGKFDLKEITQLSPFQALDPRVTGFVEDDHEILWDVVLVPVVQVRPKVSVVGQA